MKHNFLVGLGWFFVFLLVTTTAAQNAHAMYAPPSPMPLAAGQQHYYAVVLDGEGDASVAAKLIVYNKGDTPLEQLTIEIPGDRVRVINALQEGYLRQEVCAQYTSGCVKYAPTVTCAQSDSNGCVGYTRPCIEKQDRCANTQWIDDSYGYHTVNSTLTPLSHSTALTLTLPSPINPQQQSAVLLYYKAGPYADETLGRFAYDFETIKVNDDVANVRVAITVPEEFTLAGAEGDTEYRTGLSSFSSMEKTMTAPTIQSDEMASFSRQIEYQQGIVKTSASLDPLESFHVTGTYARGVFALYWERFLIGGTLIIACIACLITLGVRTYRRGSKLPAWMSSICIGIANSVAVSFIMYGGIAAVSLLMRNYAYELMIPLLAIAWIGLLLLAVFVPSIMVGVKKGATWGVLAFGVMLLALIMIGVILALLYGNSWGPTVVY